MIFLLKLLFTHCAEHDKENEYASESKKGVNNWETWKTTKQQEQSYDF